MKISDDIAIVKIEGNSCWVLYSTGTLKKVTINYPTDEKIEECRLKCNGDKRGWSGFDMEESRNINAKNLVYNEFGNPKAKESQIVYCIDGNKRNININNLGLKERKNNKKAVVVNEGKKLIRYFDSETATAEFYKDKGVDLSSISYWVHGASSSKLPFYQFTLYEDLPEFSKKTADKAKKTGVYYLTKEDIEKGNY